MSSEANSSNCKCYRTGQDAMLKNMLLVNNPVPIV